jgi:hypothetical protein
MPLINSKSIWFYGVLVFIIFAQTSAYAQETELIETISEYLLFNTGEEDLDQDELILIKEQLDYYSNYPLRINTASTFELGQFILLNNLQIASLIKYRKRYGEIYSLAELSYLPGFNEFVLNLLEPYISFKPGYSAAGYFTKSEYPDGKLLLRHSFQPEDEKGYRIADTITDKYYSGYYLGNKHKLLLQFQYEYNRNIRIGLKAEKDAGEEFFSGSNKHGFDYYTAFIEMKNIFKKANIILGDYHIHTGFGSAFSSKANYFAAASGTIDTRSLRLTPNTSVNENKFLRGVLINYNFKRVSVSTFASYKRIDANLQDSLADNIQFTSLQETGLHTTRNLIDDENVIRERIAGIYTTFSADHLSVGLGVNQVKLDGVQVNSSSSKDIHPELNTVSANVKYAIDQVLLFSEAYVNSNKYSFFQGINILPGSSMVFTFIYRKSNNDIYSVYRQNVGFSKHYKPHEGFYTSITSSPYQKLNFAYIFDYFTERESQANLGINTRNQYNLFRSTYRLNRASFSMFIRHRTKTELFKESRTRKIENTKNIQYSAQINYRISNYISIKSVFRIKSDNWGMNQAGSSLENHVKLNFNRLNSQLSMGNYTFNINNYDFRIYAYEPDVLYSFSSRLMYRNGSHNYVLLRFNASEKMKLYAKYALSVINNEIKLGSGLSEVEGNSVSEFKFQLLYNI